MISYLSNRHYQTMTQLLPEQLRQNQPKFIYYKTFINENTLNLLQKNKKVTHKTLAQSSKKKMPLKKIKAMNFSSSNRDVCPICYESHIAVEYYGQKHLCSKCRMLVRDEHGNQVKTFVNEENDIVCLGIYPKENMEEKTKYYVTDHSKLEIDNVGVYATFAGEHQLVLITRKNPGKEDDL